MTWVALAFVAAPHPSPLSMLMERVDEVGDAWGEGVLPLPRAAQALRSIPAIISSMAHTAPLSSSALPMASVAA